MSGLTEEEKALIQSVMIRAQESDSVSPQPSHTDSLTQKTKSQYSSKPQSTSINRQQEPSTSSQQSQLGGMQYAPSSQLSSNQRPLEQSTSSNMSDRMSFAPLSSQNMPHSHQGSNSAPYSSSQITSNNKMQGQTTDERVFQKPLVSESVPQKPSNTDQMSHSGMQYQPNSQPLVSAHQSDSYNAPTSRTGMQYSANSQAISNIQQKQQHQQQQQFDPASAPHQNQTSSYNVTHSLPHAPTASDLMSQRQTNNDRMIQSGFQYPMESQQAHNVQKQEIPSIPHQQSGNQYQGSNQSMVNVSQHNMSTNPSSNTSLFQPTSYNPPHAPFHTLPQIPNNDRVSQQKMENDRISQSGMSHTSNTQFMTNAPNSNYPQSKNNERIAESEHHFQQSQQQISNFRQNDYPSGNMIDDRSQQASYAMNTNERPSFAFHNLPHAPSQSERVSNSQVNNEQRSQSGMQLPVHSQSVSNYRQMDQNSDLRGHNEDQFLMEKSSVSKGYQPDMAPAPYSNDRSYYSHQLPNAPASNDRTMYAQSHLTTSIDHAPYTSSQDARSSQYQPTNDRTSHTSARNDRKSQGQAILSTSQPLANTRQSEPAFGPQRQIQPQFHTQSTGFRQAEQSFNKPEDSSTSRSQPSQEANQNLLHQQTADLSPIQDVSPTLEAAEAKHTSSFAFCSENKDQNQSEVSTTLHFYFNTIL